jgi:hypothetical protein
MGIEFSMTNGSRTVAIRPSLALMYWLGHHMPHELPKTIPSGVVVTVTETRVPSPGHPQFLTLVLACIERLWNKQPPLPDQMPNVSDPGYEGVCESILRWLSREGDITQLTIVEN